VCAHRPQTGSPTFVYIPTSGNVLRERERHIDLLEAELRQKNDWLGKSQREHQELVRMFRAQQKELEQRAEWGMQLNRDLDAAGERIRELHDEVSAEQAAAREVSAAYEAKVTELEEENRRKTQWALDTEARLGAELQVKLEELAQCVEYLHRTEVALDERAKAAERLQLRMDDLERSVALYQASRWVKLGKSFGFGPKLPAN
jgi:hypothetical protein